MCHYSASNGIWAKQTLMPDRIEQVLWGLLQHSQSPAVGSGRAAATWKVKKGGCAGRATSTFNYMQPATQAGSASEINVVVP